LPLSSNELNLLKLSNKVQKKISKISPERGRQNMTTKFDIDEKPNIKSKSSFNSNKKSINRNIRFGTVKEKSLELIPYNSNSKLTSIMEQREPGKKRAKQLNSTNSVDNFAKDYRNLKLSRQSRKATSIFVLADNQNLEHVFNVNNVNNILINDEQNSSSFESIISENSKDLDLTVKNIDNSPKKYNLPILESSDDYNESRQLYENRLDLNSIKIQAEKQSHTSINIQNNFDANYKKKDNKFNLTTKTDNSKYKFPELARVISNSNDDSIKIVNMTDRSIKENDILINKNIKKPKPIEVLHSDFEELSFRTRMKYDKRTFIQLFVESLFKYHAIFALFYRTLLIPIEIRILRILLQISLNFTMNAIFFTDEYIQARGGRDINRINSEKVILYIILGQLFLEFV